MAERQFKGQILEQPEKVKLDLLDRKILYLLCKNGRYSDTAIAKALRVKRETIAYRIKRMTEKEVLHGTLTLIDSRRLGFRTHAVHIKLNKFGSEKQVIEYLLAQECVTRINNTCGGDFDIDVVVTSRTLAELDGFFDAFLSKFADMVQEYSIFEISDEDFTGLDFLLSPVEKKGLNIVEKKGSTFEAEFRSEKASSGIINLDDKDLKLLDLMKLDGNMSIAEISHRLGLAVPAVANRIRRLVREGVIRSFIPYASLSHLGYQWYKAYFQVKNLDRSRFIEYMRVHSHITWYVKFTGTYSYECDIWARDNTEFNRILNEIRSHFSENMIKHESIIILNQLKFVQRV